MNAAATNSVAAANTTAEMKEGSNKTAWSEHSVAIRSSNKGKKAQEKKHTTKKPEKEIFHRVSQGFAVAFASSLPLSERARLA